MKYAGFIKRTAAFILDCLIIFFCSIIFYKVITIVFHTTIIETRDYLFRPWQYVFYPLFTLFVLLYYFVFETLGQAGLGKRLFSLKIVDNRDNKLALKSSLFRFLYVIIFVISTLLTNILFFENKDPICIHFKYEFPLYNYIFWGITFLCIISYVCLLFFSKKQTLYDKLTKSFVIEEKKKLGFIAGFLVLFFTLPILILIFNKFLISLSLGH